MDEASRQTRADIGLQLNSPSGNKIEQAIRLGFSTSNNESEYEAILADYVQKCGRCQWKAPVLRSPTQDLTSISSPWPFAQWGIDIVGPLPTAPAQKKLLLIAIDYFSKWIEAKAFASIKDKDVTQFV